MRLVVFSHKPCWRSAKSPSGYATDGGFPFQMRALSELFDQTVLVVPCSEPVSQAGEIVLEGHRLAVAPVTAPFGRGLTRKLLFGFWLLRNSGVIVRELWKADAVHAPIPGDVGTIGMLLAFALRKPLFVRHCGNWFKPVTKAEHFWKWFMEMFAGGKQVMLATGGASQGPSARNPKVRWIFSTTLTKNELQACGQSRASQMPAPRMIIVCRQDIQKGTGVVIESLPLVLNCFPNAHLDVVGDGPALREFRMKAEALGVNEHITFHGKVDHETVIGLLNQASLFCYPTSASEGFPKVVLEALACGLPVVSTRVSVLPLLLSAGGGELLEVSTPTKLAEAVVRILSDSDHYRALSAAALATAEQYSLEAWRDAIGTELRSAWGTLARHNWKPVSVNG